METATARIMDGDAVWASNVRVQNGTIFLQGRDQKGQEAVYSGIINSRDEISWSDDTIWQRVVTVCVAGLVFIPGKPHAIVFR